MKRLGLLLALVLSTQSTRAFSVQSIPPSWPVTKIPVHKQSLNTCSHLKHSSHYNKASSSSSALDSVLIDEGSIVVAAAEGWRQYVPLVVSVGVILDILLGSPIANLALAPMRRAAQQEGEGQENGAMSGDGKKGFVRNPKERVDSDSVAQAAIDKARNSMELRRFLEENKTDLQRAAEARDMFDREAEKFDERMSNKKT